MLYVRRNLNPASDITCYIQFFGNVRERLSAIPGVRRDYAKHF